MSEIILSNKQLSKEYKYAEKDNNFISSLQERIKRVEDILLLRKGTKFVLSELDWLRNCCYIIEKGHFEITRLDMVEEIKTN